VEHHPSRKVIALIQQIEQLRANMPAHSVAPTMLMRLEELEEQLARLQTGRADLDSAGRVNGRGDER
jgi:hypothetical protein